jgi:hypothetical protein
MKREKLAVETIPGMGRRGIKRMMKGVHSITMFCKNF